MPEVVLRLTIDRSTSSSGGSLTSIPARAASLHVTRPQSVARPRQASFSDDPTCKTTADDGTVCIDVPEYRRASRGGKEPEEARGIEAHGDFEFDLTAASSRIVFLPADISKITVCLGTLWRSSWSGGAS